MMSVPSRSWIVSSNESSWLRLIVHIGQVDFQCPRDLPRISFICYLRQRHFSIAYLVKET
jgi:hypothetical protein